MSKQVKRVFHKEFKINTVSLILSKSKKVAELPREPSVNINTLHAWKNQHEQKQEA